jgi:hypothetical protein
MLSGIRYELAGFVLRPIVDSISLKLPPLAKILRRNIVMIDILRRVEREGGKRG